MKNIFQSLKPIRENPRSPRRKGEKVHREVGETQRKLRVGLIECCKPPRNFISKTRPYYTIMLSLYY